MAVHAPAAPQMHPDRPTATPRAAGRAGPPPPAPGRPPPPARRRARVSDGRGELPAHPLRGGGARIPPPPATPVHRSLGDLERQGSGLDVDVRDPTATPGRDDAREALNPVRTTSAKAALSDRI